MIFTNEKPAGYIDCPFDSRFLIWKNDSIFTWEICLTSLNEDGYPQIIGEIGQGDEGPMKDVTNLGWTIKEEYRGQGIMKNLLELFLQSVTPNGGVFAVAILKDNLPSLKLAQSCGFSVYDEDEDKAFLFKQA